MTAIEQKGQALLAEIRNEASKLIGFNGPTYQILTIWADCVEALCRAIEQHEAFKREVSNAITDCGAERYLGRFIIAKPDHIRGAALDIGVSWGPNDSDSFRAALAARGLEIREKQ